ncbi:uncharacterized protein CIMG_06334 [Coccidioides immitis RS]|uniref:Integrase zinc-binding domain-containing protein n=4 Tax=Coccidioides immitis TaxID=5501 RepID=A0A0D8JW90_COCIM|nr:uncharacterized protein CIMG_06334 [Coccidioides immitis RS]KMU73978.1 hypothetical protein CISG_03956 [Coccidioides immitis RMSCC 3703]KMU82930.1 hypothetical protein CIHG_00712 [Coccidioides immitis H538.4]QVM11768.1 hypothetical protein D8B26_006414 [Coccidioides posadasii str. Silveira]TPX23736.1 hypothetical protein DIZ76_013075 [Coccidioides immitis]KJF60553.1 hypothetical protein CIMG_06334 [Coccidioides immitis RS]
MSHQYHSDEGQQYGYSRSGQYGLSQQSFQSYTHHLLPPYNHHSADPSSLNSSYNSSQSVYPQSPPSSLSSPAYQYPQQYVARSGCPPSNRFYFHDSLREVEIESQESFNEHTMQSEPVLPPLEGFPDVREFDQLMKSYVDDLSVKKQDKALIHSRRARNIRTVLLDPKDTAVESAQFRFWVKKMFKLEPNDARTPELRRMICHEGKPVAIREKLFKILTRAHQQCQHGGRDKTSAQVRRIYSWVPKELISRFVKICPTCQVRRGGSRLTPPNSCRSSPKLDVVPPPPILSPPDSRRESIISRSSAPYSRAELPQPTTGLNWPSSHHNNAHGGQYHGHYPVASAPTWATLPRSLSTTMHNGTGIPGSMSMGSNHMEYDSTYDESHSLQGPHY